MDAEGLGRKLLLTPSADPRRTPEKQTLGTVTASHKMLTLQALSSSLNAGTAKGGCVGRGEAFGCPPAVCPPERPRPFAQYRYYARSVSSTAIQPIPRNPCSFRDGFSCPCYIFMGDAAFLLTVGSFLLTVGAFLLTVESFSFFTYSWGFFAYSGKVRLIRALFPKNYYQYWCYILVAFLPFSTVLVIFTAPTIWTILKIGLKSRDSIRAIRFASGS